MKILITGGAGFIGSHAAAHLRAAGHEVELFDLADDPARNPAGSRDIRDPATIAAAVHGCDAVIHLAAQVSAPASLDNPDETLAINVEGSRNVLDAARAAKVQKVVLASSAAVYGLNPHTPTSEEEPFAPLTPYAESKIRMEQLAAESPVPTVCLRFFNVYGPGQKADSQYAAVIPAFLTRAKRGETLTIYGDGEQTRDFINVTDVCRAIEQALTTDTGDHLIVNIATGTAVTINQLAQTIIALTKSESKVEHAPARDGDPRTSLADVTLAKEKLGFTANIGLEEGLRRMMRNS